MEQHSKRDLTDLEFLCKSQLISKIKEYEKSVAAHNARLRKAFTNLQSQRDQIKDLNEEVERLKLENKHLQTILIREAEGEEQQNLVELLIKDFKDERRNYMSLEHSLMVTKWELTERKEDVKDLSEEVREKDKRYEAEMEKVKAQLQELELREQGTREWITEREYDLNNAEENLFELEEELQEKDQMIEDLKDELHNKNQKIDKLKEELNKCKNIEKAQTQTTLSDTPPSNSRGQVCDGLRKSRLRISSSSKTSYSRQEKLTT